MKDAVVGGVWGAARSGCARDNGAQSLGACGAIRRANLAKRFVKLIKAINFNNWLRRWRYTIGVAAMVIACAFVHNIAFPGSAAAAWAQARSSLKALLPL
ncbi:hypothetical protein CYMTET_16823 [Cymbomonas tetramitiformis]|uniref:Uncharacterized protein n=1 Tax=Cymbomonas tetramitiformis TaxID=36881 RepID=A0AAE0L7W3_9CHLO|nr:hypothetical protein CYMTET_16823 [Cymbomonas tetramitiformis]